MRCRINQQPLTHEESRAGNGGGGGGGTPISRLYRYVPLWRVGFSNTLFWDRIPAARKVKSNGAYPGFRSMKRLGVLLLLLDGMLVHHR